MGDLDQKFEGLAEAIDKAMTKRYPQNAAPKEGGEATKLESGINKATEDVLTGLTKALSDLTSEVALLKAGKPKPAADDEPDEDDAAKAVHKATTLDDDDDLREVVKGLASDVHELAEAVEGLSGMVGVIGKRTKTPLQKSIAGQDDFDSDDEGKVSKTKGTGGKGSFDGFVRAAYEAPAGAGVRTVLH